MKTTTELIEICNKAIKASTEPHQRLAYHRTVDYDLFLDTFTPEFVKELLVNERITNSVLKSREANLGHILEAANNCY